MKTSVKDPIRELKSVLAEHLPWHGARIDFLAQFLLALLKVRSVSLAELATGFGGPAQVESHYKRLQRFFRGFAFDQATLARLLVRLVGVGDGPWRLTMDRTHWRFGKTDLNVLVLGIAHRGIALPVFWSVLDQPGHSDTPERIALMERFLRVFGAGRTPPCWPTASWSARTGFAGSSGKAFRSTNASSATPACPTPGTG